MPRPNCWIIEDEPPALRRLTKLLTTVRPELEVSFTTDSIATGRRALGTRPSPDFVFSDIHLADGLCFDLWEEARVDFPIIFTTAYDQYGIRAFRVNSIDYLLKPIEVDALSAALDKLDRNNASRISPDWSQIARLIEERRPAYRSRFLAQYRGDWLPVPVADLSQLYSQDGMTFALSYDNHRYLLDEPLDRIEAELDPAEWFRINRAQIVHIDAVRKASPYFNHRLALELSPKGELENVVSRPRVKACREWMSR